MTPPSKRKLISVVTGVFNEEAIVKDVYTAIGRVFSKLPQYDYEHIFMDNCSTDATLLILKKIAAKDKRVKILSYTKNFGPEKSGWIGLMHTSGSAVIPYEGSMKDPETLIPVFIKHWENGYDLVLGVRTQTADSSPMAFMRRLFYKIIRLLSQDDLPENVGSYGLYDKKIIDELRKLDDYKPYIRGLIALLGFKHIEVPYVRKRRPKGKGKSKSSIGYLLDFAINALVSNSIIPIRLCTYLGVGLSFVSLLTALLFLLLKTSYWKVTIPGVSATILLILFFAGIQLFFLGIIGEYVGAIHAQTRQKPFVVIREKVNI